MKHLFFMAVIGYCGALLALQHLPAMAGATGIKESGPWLLAMIADAVLGVATCLLKVTMLVLKYQISLCQTTCSTLLSLVGVDFTYS